MTQGQWAQRVQERAKVHVLRPVNVRGGDGSFLDPDTHNRTGKGAQWERPRLVRRGPGLTRTRNRTPKPPNTQIGGKIQKKGAFKMLHMGQMINDQSHPTPISSPRAQPASKPLVPVEPWDYFTARSAYKAPAQHHNPRRACLRLTYEGPVQHHTSADPSKLSSSTTHALNSI